MKSQNRVLLYNIRSTHNVGSIFRTADTLGIEKLYLVGTTPTPIDRFERVRLDIAKVALGAEKVLDWEYLKEAKTTISKLKKEGWNIIAIEQNNNSVDYKKIKTKNKNLFIIGEEVNGITNDILKLANQIGEIPMQGKKESLNVSVAFGVALFRILNK